MAVELISPDPGETVDLAPTQPEKLQQLVAFWHQYEAETGTVLQGKIDQPSGFGRFTGVNWDDWGL